jgi:hypothetical protein
VVNVMFQTERERQHQAMAEAFALVDLEADTALFRARQIAEMAEREHDPERRAEYEGLAEEWRAKASKLKAEALEQNAALDRFARG